MYIQVEGKYTGTEYGELLSDEGLTANIFRKGSFIYKVFNAGYPEEFVFREAHTISYVKQLDIATAGMYEVFKKDGFWVVKMEYIRGDMLMDDILKAIYADNKRRLDKLIWQMAELHFQIGKRRGYALQSYKTCAQKTILENSVLSEAQKEKTVEYLRNLADGTALLHGDFHPFNIIYQDGKPYTIDWFTGSCGTPACDVARTYLNLTYPPIPELKEVQINKKYFDAYGALSGMAQKEIECWFPVIASMTIGGTDPNWSRQMRQYLL